MDDRQGNLRPIDRDLANSLEDSRLALEKMASLHDSLAPSIPSVFSVGEEIEIKNSKFKVLSLGKNYMKLKLLPHAELTPQDAEPEDGQ